MENNKKTWINDLMKNYKVPSTETKQEPKRILTENQIQTIKESK